MSEKQEKKKKKINNTLDRKTSKTKQHVINIKDEKIHKKNFIHKTEDTSCDNCSLSFLNIATSFTAETSNPKLIMIEK